MGSRRESGKWLSDGAHPKEARKKYEGADLSKNGLRDVKGVPTVTKVNPRGGECLACRAPVKPREGWVITTGRGLGQNGTPFAVMCHGCGGQPVSPETVPPT